MAKRAPCDVMLKGRNFECANRHRCIFMPNRVYHLNVKS